jgi:hypothetical protein
MKPTGFIIVIMLFNVSYLSAQPRIFLKDGSDYTYSNLKTQTKESSVTYLMDNDIKTTPKVNIIAYTDDEGKWNTFQLKTGAKMRLKDKGSLDDPCFKAEIYAYRYLGSKDQTDNPYANGNECYDQKAKKIKAKRTLGLVAGGFVFILGVSLFSSSLSQANSL